MASRGPRQSLPEITAGYDRVARHYSKLELLFLITPRARRKAVAALQVKPGDTVLEVGVGSGRNLPYLVEAVGSQGRVIGIDASAGMLAEARRLAAERGWTNVDLRAENAERLELEMKVDAVLFALSYSVIPDPEAALHCAWTALAVGGRVVIMDAGLTETRLGRVLGPIAKLLTRLGPGDPYARPWQDFEPYGPVEVERFMFGIYYVLSAEKRAYADSPAARSASG